MLLCCSLLLTLCCRSPQQHADAVAGCCCHAAVASAATTLNKKFVKCTYGASDTSELLDTVVMGNFFSVEDGEEEHCRHMLALDTYGYHHYYAADTEEELEYESQAELYVKLQVQNDSVGYDAIVVSDVSGERSQGWRLRPPWSVVMLVVVVLICYEFRGLESVFVCMGFAWLLGVLQLHAGDHGDVQDDRKDDRADAHVKPGHDGDDQPRPEHVLSPQLPEEVFVARTGGRYHLKRDCHGLRPSRKTETMSACAICCARSD
jgi:hypothetical protein